MTRFYPVRRKKTDNLADVVASRITKDAVTGCWNWTWCASHDGYGLLSIGGRHYYAHRLSYELFVGPIPEGLTVDHKCHNTSCINPDHLRPATMRDNIVKFGKTNACAVNSRRTHCKHGHQFNRENTKIRPNGSRRCITCHRRRVDEYQRRKRGHQTQGITEDGEHQRPHKGLL